jgi:4-hydroxybenzoate polyprenyltransferase
MSRMNKISARVLTGWGIVVAGTALALLVAWAARAVRVTPVTLLTIGAVVSALTWLIVLVSVPWNLYFAAGRAVQEAAVSRERGISVRPAIDAEARLISRRMLGLALGGHLGTAVAAAAIAYFSGSEAGYYVAGIFLLATAFRPAGAYLVHMRERIGVLTRESTHPREDVVTIRAEVDGIRKSLGELRTELRDAGRPSAAPRPG